MFAIGRLGEDLQRVALGLGRCTLTLTKADFADIAVVRNRLVGLDHDSLLVRVVAATYIDPLEEPHSEC